MPGNCAGSLTLHNTLICTATAISNRGPRHIQVGGTARGYPLDI